jgi:D-3-phosphoglycerate dehydrogenase
MPRVLLLDNLSEEGTQVFKSAGFSIDVRPPMSAAELAAVVGEFDGLVVRSATKVTADALVKPGKLKVIGRAGAGTDNIDKNAATKHGIVVMNTPGGNTISTCEHTFALMLAMCRNIPAAHVTMEAGRWDRNKFMGAELYGKTLGIIGVGRIGGALAKRALAFEMKVLAFDPLLSPVKAESLGVELVTLDELIERSDFISLHAPKTEKTTNMLSMEQFKKMKPNCRIVNCARGGLVNEKDLAVAVKEKIIAGAALDVFTAEPFTENPFIGIPNIIMTPHLAASTDEAQLTVAVDIAHQMVDYLTTGAIVNAVNVPSLDSETRKLLQPFINLAEKLGRFQSSYAEGRPSSIEIEYCGDLNFNDTYPVTATVLTSFLAPVVETVNMVNVPTLLKERGIAFTETRSAQSTDYAFQINVKVSTDQGSFTVAGTLSRNNEPRICQIDGTRVEAVPEGHMVICINDDKPMVLGRIAMVIGEAGVNIANLFLGRDLPGGKAMTVLNVDGPIGEAVVQSVRQIKHVREVRVVRL